MGIDGFRVDMAEMVPVEFWRWVIGQVNMRYPSMLFIAETYDMTKYREYIEAGFNLLYDKVNFYDTVRDVVMGRKPAIELTHIWRRTEGLVPNMLYFLENHDEQRLASDFFAGDPLLGKPAMMLAALMNKASVMIYFGQELGVRGMDEEGFSGLDGRTTIFDYWCVEEVQSFVSNYTYDERNLSAETCTLRAWYGALLNMVKESKALSYGEFYDLMWVNQHVDNTSIYAFIRYDDKERYLIVLNFSDRRTNVSIAIPDDAWSMMGVRGKKSVDVDVYGHDGVIIGL
jgi:glycosidase